MDSKLPSQKCQNSGFHWMKLSRGLKWCTEKLQINLTHFSWVEYTNMSHLDPLWGPLGTHNDSNRTSPLTKWSHLLSHLKVHKPPKDFERHICSRIHEFIWTTGTLSWKENVVTLPERECQPALQSLLQSGSLLSFVWSLFPWQQWLVYFCPKDDCSSPWNCSRCYLSLHHAHACSGSSCSKPPIPPPTDHQGQTRCSAP